MDIGLLQLFQRQVLVQCEFLLMAVNDVSIGLQSYHNTRVFYGLQNLLNAAANISKALWGQGASLATQRQPLRDSIGVLDSSPLRNVTMRNNFEHFDERLDKWQRESLRHNYVDFGIMPKSTVQGIESIDLFRAFDPEASTLYFWSQEFNIKEIIEEVRKILPKLRKEVGEPE